MDGREGKVENKEIPTGKDSYRQSRNAKKMSCSLGYRS